MVSTETAMLETEPTEERQIETLLASIVEVTKQREQIALEQCLSQLIARLTASLHTSHVYRTVGRISRSTVV